ncbi:hypothetical protein GUA87_04820 [Sneathiella sp. P13V-1]|uniref:FecR domain-containing protein n=1 Tax=Sneathiella sp. P13V-1 TaxID=2697366 RepID=UPI00187BB48E|nr:FecR domain-containing protein [Sneathiella sp. P13V-1]MBE7636156.1 hypothetical protein [Sneathiella sp. P13V-1]
MSIRTYETQGEAGTSQTLVYQVGDPVHVPHEAFLADASYFRRGTDLIIRDELSTEIVVQDYFGESTLPRIANQWGAGLDGNIVAKLAGPGLVAQNTPASTESGVPIGTVESLSGQATVQHANGVSELLEAGQAVFADDVIETGPGGIVGIVFKDQTTLTVGTNSRMVIDEFAYDSSGSDGSLGVSFLKGAFSFVSGKIAKNDYSDVSLKVPYGSIGIRGTEFVVDVRGDGSTTISVIDGSVAVIRGDSEVLLNIGQLVTLGEMGFSPVTDLLIEVIKTKYPTLFEAQRRTLEKRDTTEEERREHEQEEEERSLSPDQAPEGEPAPLDRAFEDDFLDVVSDEEFLPNNPGDLDIDKFTAILDLTEGPLTPRKDNPHTESLLHILNGTPGDDYLMGTNGDNILNGLGGDDALLGTGGNDTLYGGGGHDTLIGGTGTDLLIGGVGDDVFNYSSFSEAYVHMTDSIASLGLVDQIDDFASGTDKIKLDGATFTFSGVYNPGTDFIDIGGAAYDGTNAGVITAGTIIFGNNTVYYEDDSSSPGYVVIAETSDSTVAATDIIVTSPP